MSVDVCVSFNFIIRFYQTGKILMALSAAMALSGLNEECFSDGLKDVFNHGAVLLKTPSSSSLASSELSQESGISSMSSDSSIVRNLRPYFELLYQTEIELKEPNETKDETLVNEPKTKEIFYKNRNILDLATNIAWREEFRPAILQPGTKFFFENRSLYSRVFGDEILDPIMVPCPVQDCAFNEPQYG